MQALCNSQRFLLCNSQMQVGETTKQNFKPWLQIMMDYPGPQSHMIRRSDMVFGLALSIVRDVECRGHKKKKNASLTEMRYVSLD